MSLLTAASHSLQNCIAFQLLADPAATSRAQMACKVLNDEYADPIIWKSACLLQVGALLVDKSENPLICSNFIQTSTRSVGQCRCLMALDHLIYIRCSPIRSFAALASAGVESRLNLWVDPQQTVLSQRDLLTIHLCSRVARGVPSVDPLMSSIPKHEPDWAHLILLAVDHLISAC